MNVTKVEKIKRMEYGESLSSSNGRSALKGVNKVNLIERTNHFRDKLINKFNTDKFEILEYTATRKPFTIKCLQCGRVKSYHRAENILTNKYICSCQKPKPNLTKEGLEAKNKFIYWYNKIGHKKYYLLKNFTTINTPITLQCKNCGSIQNRKVKELLKNDKCLSCERHLVVPKSQKAFIKQVNDKYGGEFEIIDEYKNSFIKVKVRHTLCGKVLSIRPHDLLSRTALCPICDKSKGEKAIEKFLIENNIDYLPQYRLKEFKRAPYDFYLPQYNLLIEFQGRQHYEPVKKFGGEAQFQRQKEIDVKKSELAAQVNKELLIISYLDYSNINEILVQRLFK